LPFENQTQLLSGNSIWQPLQGTIIFHGFLAKPLEIRNYCLQFAVNMKTLVLNVSVDNKFCHNIVKVVCRSTGYQYFDNVMVEFMINNRTDT